MRDLLDPKKANYLRLILNAQHKGPLDPILKFLPPGDQEAVHKAEVANGGIKQAFIEPESFLNRVHYSWLIEPIQNHQDPLRSLFVGALSEKQGHALAKKVSLSTQVPAPKGLLRLYLQKQLLQAILPRDYVPIMQTSSELKVLLDLSKTELTDVIDFLGLYDLAHELKRVVDTKTLKLVYQILSPKKIEYLKVCMHQKEKVNAPPLNVHAVVGEPAQFEHLLHQRGCVRLANALMGSSPSFLWVVTHTLDSGRGALIEKLTSKKEVSSITPMVSAQVLQVINFLRKK